MFYKLIGEYLHYGPSVQHAHGVYLHPDATDLPTLPYDGWYWFETEEEAKNFFNIND
jgi:hypothetical protein